MAESAKGDYPLIGHLERHLQMSISADTAYDIFGSKCDLFPRLMPQEFQQVDKITDEVWLWTFVDANKCGTWKNSVKCSEETMSVTWTLLDGEVPKKLYKTLKVDYQFSPNEKGCEAYAKLTYEKNDVTVPIPHDYMDFICGMLKAANTPLKH